uniref:Uncharacterized protein n=1 Tax=Microviridae sp. cthcR2 TaxID=2826741 RepID=A0A8S5NP57_9VIRU|nr:MAG TPA: hypothetical protein [Microviridae sp. cthcR2]
MEAKKYCWLLKLSYVTDDGNYTVSYVNVFDSTKKEVMYIVDKYRKDFVVVHVYKLQPAL